jgi:hypothetical protein
VGVFEKYAMYQLPDGACYIVEVDRLSSIRTLTNPTEIKRAAWQILHQRRSS